MHLEREYLFDPADMKELWLWYRYSLIGVLGLAAVSAAISYPLTTIRWPDTAPRVAHAVFWITAFALGILGTPVFNRWTGVFIFTWPVCLFVAHQWALNTVVWSNPIASSTPRSVLGAHRHRFLPRNLSGLLPRLPPAQSSH